MLIPPPSATLFTTMKELGVFIFCVQDFLPSILALSCTFDTAEFPQITGCDFLVDQQPVIFRIRSAFLLLSAEGLLFIFNCLLYFRCPKKVRKKSRECHNHKPQPFPDPKRKRKPTNLNKHKPNKRTKSTKISSLFPKRGNRNTKRTEKHKNKMTHGKTYNKSPHRINHKATKSKTITGITALERSVVFSLGFLRGLAISVPGGFADLTRMSFSFRTSQSREPSVSALQLTEDNMSRHICAILFLVDLIPSYLTRC